MRGGLFVLSIWLLGAVAQEQGQAHSEIATQDMGVVADGCSLKFVSYEPSDWETEWFANIEEWSLPGQDICGRMLKTSDHITEYLEGVQLIRRDGESLSDRGFRWRHIFSYFNYHLTCDGTDLGTTKRAIEPIVGLMRHPLAELHDNPEAITMFGIESYKDTTGSTNHLVLDSAFEPTFHYLYPSGKRLLLDVGSSGWWHSSLQWFVNHYAAQGIEFNNIFAWDKVEMDRELVYLNVPEDLRSRFEWFNGFIDLETNNPWTTLRKHAKPSDFVVIKVDFDTAPLERQLMDQLLDDPRNLELIDEVYFEHHVAVEPIKRYWDSMTLNETLPDAYRLMERFRQAGVRFHAWI